MGQAKRPGRASPKKPRLDYGALTPRQRETLQGVPFMNGRLRAAYESPMGMPVYDRKAMAGGSLVGAPIWAMREAWLSDESILAKRCKESGRWAPTVGRKNPYRTALAAGHDKGFANGEAAADPDGFAVFGRFPKNWLVSVLQQQLLGSVRRDDILHVCSGTLQEKWTVDLRFEARPRVQADGCHLPFPDSSFPAVLLDPPYSDAYAQNLYGTENPRPSWLLVEAARVCQPNGRIGLLHVAVPFAPPGCRLRNVYGLTIGVGFRIRAFTVFEKTQPDLFSGNGHDPR